MWNYSCILRHHRYGEFEDWDKVLEEIASRDQRKEWVKDSIDND